MKKEAVMVVTNGAGKMTTKRRLIYFVIAVAMGLVLISSEKAPAAMAQITVTVTNSGSFDHTYELKDGVSGRAWTQAIGAGGSVPVSLQSNQSLDDGYGDIYWRASGNSTWNHSSMLRNGEKVTL